MSKTTDQNELDEYYPHSITYTIGKTPNTFKIAINTRIEKLKKIYWTWNKQSGNEI